MVYLQVTWDVVFIAQVKSTSMKYITFSKFLVSFILILIVSKSTPQSLSVDGHSTIGLPGDGNNLLTFNTERPWIFRQLGTGSGAALELYSTVGLKNFILNTTGSIGIGMTNPEFKLDVSDRIRIRSGGASSTAGIWLNNPSNSSVIAFMGIKEVDVAGWYGNNSGWGLVMNTNTGAISVGNQNPVAGYRLSVQGNEYLNGLLLTTGDAEIGGAAQVMGNLNVGGWIGIGGSPSMPLEIHSALPDYNYLSSWTKYDNGAFTSSKLCIQAHGMMIAEAYWATSDARIKNLIGRSNSSEDLKIISALQITDYTMKDSIKYGNDTFKKVIAQQVEEVYPQVVSTKTDFIPNVFAVPASITSDDSGTLLTFIDPHNISQMAKKIKVIVENETRQFEILSIPSDHDVLIKAEDLSNFKVFVYGEEVADFRVVDYEGLTTLNISATQELTKIITRQQAEIDAQNLRINELNNMIMQFVQLKQDQVSVQNTQN